VTGKDVSGILPGCQLHTLHIPCSVFYAQSVGDFRSEPYLQAALGPAASQWAATWAARLGRLCRGSTIKHMCALLLQRQRNLRRLQLPPRRFQHTLSPGHVCPYQFAPVIPLIHPEKVCCSISVQSTLIMTTCLVPADCVTVQRCACSQAAVHRNRLMCSQECCNCSLMAVVLLPM